MKKALGKGISALIPDSYVNDQVILGSPGERIENRIEEGGGLQFVPMDKIKLSEKQPRKSFDPEKIEELALSIKEKGILQPVIVKKLPDDQYLLVCGERRLRAAKLCEIDVMPVVIKEIADQDLLEWALVENIQREDLNPMEEAEAYTKLAEEKLMSNEEIAKKIGKDRSTVANMIRLLRLPEEVKHYIGEGLLTTGHARAILGLLTPEHQRQMAKRIVEEKLSVRQVELIVNRSNAQKRKPKSARYLSPDVLDLEQRLEKHLGTKAKIYPKKSQREGRIEIYYYSLDELDRCLEKIGLPKG